jgi:hypothetical protein
MDKKEQIGQLISEAQSDDVDLRSSTDALMVALASNPDANLVSMVEEALHPAGPRPREPLPREWYNYVVLYDAYVECHSTWIDRVCNFLTTRSVQ